MQDTPLDVSDITLHLYFMLRSNAAYPIPLYAASLHEHLGIHLCCSRQVNEGSLDAASVAALLQFRSHLSGVMAAISKPSCSPVTACKALVNTVNLPANFRH